MPSMFGDLSPVKINLGLEVHHRRPSDGYHYISSIFIPITFGDRLSFKVSDAESIVTHNRLSGQAFIEFEKVSERGDFTKNLLSKTIQNFKPYLGDTFISIELEKIVPPGSGIGGGSSNAGMLIRFLINNFDIPKKTAHEIAASLGADIPFFLQEGAALVYGTGEFMKKIEIGPGYGVLCLPGIHVNTKVAYSKLKRPLQPDAPPETLSSMSGQVSDALKSSHWDLVSALSNDFEKPVFEMHPELGRLKESFYDEGASYCSLSGSGSAVYALVPSKMEQRRVLERMAARNPDYQFEPFQFPL